MAKNIAVYGIYPSRQDAGEGVEALRSAGYRDEDISVLVPENVGTKDLSVEKHTKAPEAAVAGAAAGGVVGGALAWLASAGLIAIPGIGPALAAGPIVALLTGVGAVGVAGGVVGALVGSGMPEYEAKRYEGRLHTGGVLVSVHCDNSQWARRAKDLLSRTGAEDISSAGEADADFAIGDKPSRRRE